MADRILRTGYGDDRGWSLGENIAWGSGQLATAAEIQRAWMESPGHKANILRRAVPRDRDRDRARRAGRRGRDGATYTADFGVRR